MLRGHRGSRSLRTSRRHPPRFHGRDARRIHFDVPACSFSRVCSVDSGSPRPARPRRDRTSRLARAGTNPAGPGHGRRERIGELAGKHADGWLPNRFAWGWASRFAVTCMRCVLRARGTRGIVLRHDAGGDPCRPVDWCSPTSALAHRVSRSSRRHRGSPRRHGRSSRAGLHRELRPRPSGRIPAAPECHRPPRFLAQRMEHIEQPIPLARTRARAFGTLAQQVVEVLAEGIFGPRPTFESRRPSLIACTGSFRHDMDRSGPAAALQPPDAEARLRAFATVRSVESRRDGPQEVEHRLQDVPLEIDDEERAHPWSHRSHRSSRGRAPSGADFKTMIDIRRKLGRDGAGPAFSALRPPAPHRAGRHRHRIGHRPQAKTGIEIGNWSESELAAGIDQAQAIVRAMRAGSFESTASSSSGSRWNRRIRPVDQPAIPPSTSPSRPRRGGCRFRRGRSDLRTEACPDPPPPARARPISSSDTSVSSSMVPVRGPFWPGFTRAAPPRSGTS